MALDGDVTEYEDVQTSYDTAFDQLVTDAFPAGLTTITNVYHSGVSEEAFNQGEEFLHSISPQGMGIFIEQKLGDDLQALQQPGREAEYAELVDFVNGIRPDSAEDLLAVYQQIATPKTFSAVLMSQAGVEPNAIETFLTKLENAPVARENLNQLLQSVDIASLITPGSGSDEAMQSANGIFADIAEDPDSFITLAQTDAFAVVVGQLSDPNTANSGFDQNAIFEVVENLPLDEKVTFLMQMGQATDQEIGAFQERLSTVIEQRPELEAQINDAISNLAQRENATGINTFTALQQSADVFESIATSDLAGSPVFDDLLALTAQHINNGGALDQTGAMDLIAGISLQEKTALFMEMGGSTPEEIAQFQTTLETALEANPEFSTVIDNAIMNSITQASAETGTTGNVMDTLQTSAEFFSDYANSNLITSVLTDPRLMDEIIVQSQAEGDNLDSRFHSRCCH